MRYRELRINIESISTAATLNIFDTYALSQGTSWNLDFRDNPDEINEVQITEDIADQNQALKDTLDAWLVPTGIYETEIDENYVYLYITNPLYTFTRTSETGAGFNSETIINNNFFSSISIQGIGGDLYLVENPVYVNITNVDPTVNYIDLTITDLSNQQTSKPQRLYNLGQNINVDISALVKSFVKEPKHNANYTYLTPFDLNNNYIKAKISFKQVFSTGDFNIQEFNKTFIRGGRKTYSSNQRLSVNSLLAPVSSLPVFPGYPVDWYYINEDKRIYKSNILPTQREDVRRVKGCDPLYFKFLNSLGGYSYWLFENSEEESSNRNLGSINRQNNIVDLGNEADFSITVISKVPVEYYELIEDLIFSEEIYIYRPSQIRLSVPSGQLSASPVDYNSNLWERVSSDGNRISKNVFDVNNKVSLNFKPYYRYNPSLLW